MLRNDLLENGYNFETIEPKKYIINLLWTGVALIFIVPVLVLYFLIINDYLADISLPYIDLSATVINITFIAVPVIYFILKEILTSLLSSDKNGKNKNIQMKYTPDTGIPVWVGREAFKTWQILIIYLTPLILIYPLLILASIVSGGNINLLVLFLIMTFFMSSDLTLVIYVLNLKIRYNADYVAVKNHVYMLTLYSRESIDRKSYIDGFTDRLNKIKKSIKYSMPPINLKTVLIPIIIAVMLFVSVKYIFANKESFIEINPDDFDTYLEYCNATQPIIKEYKGDTFSDIYHSAGEYAGCEYLAGHNIIYCNDTGSLIYFDSEKNSVMRLNANDKAERLCIYEDCRSNSDKTCGHMPDFLSIGCYSDGVLYGAQSYSSTNKDGREIIKSYIIRYNIDENKMDKLIEFEMGDEDAYIRNMFIYSGYLYALVSSDDMTQLTVARIDFEKEEACKVYSDSKDAKNRAKIEGLMYNENTILSSADGTLYSCGADLADFKPISSFNYGNVQRFDTHNGNIYYFASYLYGYIFNDNNKAYDTIVLYDFKEKKSPAYVSVFNIITFCTDSDFLYFTLRETRFFYYPNGVYSHSELYEDGIIYRVKLDDSKELEVFNIDFNNKFAVYTPEPGYSLGEWSVKDDCIYAVLNSGGEETLRRIKISSNNDMYVFW